MTKKCYKGFNPDMTCRDFQYEEGKEYETDEAKLCACGFHACEAPLDVFGYYPPVNDNGELNKFHEVELEEISDEKSDDTKVVAKKIKVGAELNFFGLAKAHVEWVKSNVDKENMKTNTGDQSAATNTGYQSAATNTGYQSAATNTGDQSAATNTGDRSAATNTGDRSAATNTGYRSAATNTGYQSAATNTGDRSAATNTGESSIAVAWGIDSKARAGKGSYIVIADWRWHEKHGVWKFHGAKMHVVDGKTIKPNVFYKLQCGKFVEAENQDNEKEN